MKELPTIYDRVLVVPHIIRGVIFYFQTRVKMQDPRIRRVEF